MIAVRVHPIPTAVVPTHMGAMAFHPVANDRAAICGECGYRADHPITRVCTAAICPRHHGSNR